MPSRAIVTGGAGFIGSHLANRLAENGFEVVVLDNFSGPKKSELARFDHTAISVQEVNLVDLGATIRGLGESPDVIFHFAADPDVRTSVRNPISHFENNVKATFNVLEAMRQKGTRQLVFASSSVVYGDARVFPTPEEHPLDPISIYGSTKLACEVLIKGYSEAFGIRALILRPANIVGSHGTHGVILDFINKLKKNGSELEILGDGTQSKSYVHVSDCVDAVVLGYKHFAATDVRIETLNISNSDATSVQDIAKIVAQEMGLGNVPLRFVEGGERGRGWKGDVKTVLLSTLKLTNLGWRPALSSQGAVEKATSELISEFVRG